MTPLDDLYPPSPTTIARDVTRPPPAYRLQVIVVLLSLILFLVIYVGLTALAAYGVYWSFQQAVNPTMAGGRVGRARSDPWLYFLGLGPPLWHSFLFPLQELLPAIAEERGSRCRGIREGSTRTLRFHPPPGAPKTAAPLPHRVFVSHEVNACVFFNQSFWSLIIPAKKNLLIGLGLVNRLNLTEFKAVLAHEFGHFSQNLDAAGRVRLHGQHGPIGKPRLLAAIGSTT